MVNLLLAVIYIAFISLGLPDGLLGAAWPSMYESIGADVSYAGAVSMLIALGTIISSLMSDRLTRRFGTAKVTAASVGITAVMLLLFSVSNSYWMLVLFALPYGLGAGGVDASLNNYVALHYESRHMSWLHCMWGIGASVGPYLMGAALTGGYGWHAGYRLVGLMQVFLSICLFMTIPMWKSRPSTVIQDGQPVEDKALTLAQTFRITGVKEILLMFFCYSVLEQTPALWAASYLVLHHGMDADIAAFWATMVYTGITVGRAISGFATMRFNDTQMIRIGQSFIATGILFLFLPFGQVTALIGLVLIGFGCAPIYPCIIHSTPAHFGADKSQAIIGVQMASAYTGTCLMPTLFGVIAQYLGIRLLPVYLLIALAAMVFMHERLCKVCPIDT